MAEGDGEEEDVGTLPAFPRRDDDEGDQVLHGDGWNSDQPSHRV